MYPRWDCSYARLPDTFWQRIDPVKSAQPNLIFLNQELKQSLELPSLNSDQAARVWSGSEILPGSIPVAMAYAGHQFGHFVPQLGDGRAHLLGEWLSPKGDRWDIHLKGSGQTRFSRRGDGRAALGPMIREWILGEAFFGLGIPASRALAVVATGESVQRNRIEPGGVLARVARGHIRVGTFEYFAARGEWDHVKLLADYCIDRFFPDARQTDQPYRSFFSRVVQSQARLVASWMQVGFIHGVLNTDNTFISGETLDFGPCAFQDEFKSDAVFSSIDQHGRYAYSQQGPILQWNLKNLALCLLKLFDEDTATARAFAEVALDEFKSVFENDLYSKLTQKIGLLDSVEARSLVTEFLSLLQARRVDFTNGFRNLMTSLDLGVSSLGSDEIAQAWHQKWIQAVGDTRRLATSRMHQANPIYIPRNHWVEKAIRDVVDNKSLTLANELVEAVRQPFDQRSGFEKFTEGPTDSERVCETFCGT